MADTQAAGNPSTPLTPTQAADKFAQLLSPPKDQESAGEAQNAETSDATPPEDRPDEQAETPEAEVAPVAGSDDEVVFTLTDGEGKDLPITRAEARKGYARQQDATRKWQAAAELRKASEAEAEQYRGARTQYAEQVTALRKAYEAIQPQDPPETLRDSNPVEYFAQRDAIREHRDTIAKLKAEEARVNQEADADRQKQAMARLVEEEEKLLLAMPEWKDPAKGRQAIEGLRDYARERGFTDQELPIIFGDHRSILLFRDAMAYRDLQAKKPDLKKRVEQVKTTAPGGRQPPPPPGQERVRAVERLTKTGKIRDAAEAFKRLG